MATTFLTTKVSTKGQVILPKAVRDQTGWAPGTTLNVQVTRDGVLLKPASPFPRTKPGTAFGILKDDRKSLTIEEMDEAITREIEERRARGRY